MLNIFDEAESFFQEFTLEKKLTLTEQCWQSHLQGNLSLNSNGKPLDIAAIHFPPHPILMPPKHMPARNLNSTAGLQAFFHALAHIEFIAIYLAWDILYRFRNLPDQFYLDWLKIAMEEALHFRMLNQHLTALGITYGDLPAHHGLWEHAIDTQDNLLARLALVPRCLEARGLDVTPRMIKKFAAAQDTEAVTVLTRILQDEIGHVERGSYWFNYLCIEQQLDPLQHFQNMLNTYYKGGKPKGPFNHQLRQQAGFTHAELNWLENANS